MDVLDAAAERARLSEAVRQAHELDIAVRARISLDPRFSAVPALVDMAATFGLEDARFVVQPYPARARTRPPGGRWPTSPSWCARATRRADRGSCSSYAMARGSGRWCGI